MAASRSVICTLLAATPWCINLPQVKAHQLQVPAVWRDRVAAALQRIATKPGAHVALLLSADGLPRGSVWWPAVADLVAGGDCRHLVPLEQHTRVLTQVWP